MPTGPRGGVLRQLRRARLLQDSPSDRRLLEDFISRHDEAAFEALLRRHGPMGWEAAVAKERRSEASYPSSPGPLGWKTRLPGAGGMPAPPDRSNRTRYQFRFTRTSPVVARSPDRATAPTAGLPSTERRPA